MQPRFPIIHPEVREPQPPLGALDLDGALSAGYHRRGIDNMAEGQWVYVPLGARRRLEHPIKLPMVLTAVQIKTDLG